MHVPGMKKTANVPGYIYATPLAFQHADFIQSSGKRALLKGPRTKEDHLFTFSNGFLFL